MIYQGIEIELDSIGKVYQAAMEKIQSGLDLACAAAPLPEDFCKHIHDPGNTASFFAAAPMVTQPLMESSLRRMLNDKDLFPGGPGSQLIVGVAQEKLKEFNAINLNIMLAMFIGGGMPSRGTEFISISIAPSSMVPRHVFLESSPKGPMIRTRIAYNKVRIYIALSCVPVALTLHLRPTMRSTTRNQFCGFSNPNSVNLPSNILPGFVIR